MCIHHCTQDQQRTCQGQQDQQHHCHQQHHRGGTPHVWRVWLWLWLPCVYAGMLLVVLVARGGIAGHAFTYCLIIFTQLGFGFSGFFSIFIILVCVFVSGCNASTVCTATHLLCVCTTCHLTTLCMLAVQEIHDHQRHRPSCQPSLLWSVP